MNIDDNAKPSHYSSEIRAKPFLIFCFLKCKNKNQNPVTQGCGCSMSELVTPSRIPSPELCLVESGRSSGHSEEYRCTVKGCPCDESSREKPTELNTRMATPFQLSLPRGWSRPAEELPATTEDLLVRLSMILQCENNFN